MTTVPAKAPPGKFIDTLNEYVGASKRRGRLQGLGHLAAGLGILFLFYLIMVSSGRLFWVIAIIGVAMTLVGFIQVIVGFQANLFAYLFGRN